MKQKKFRSNGVGVQLLIGAIAGGLVSTFSTPAQAADVFDNTGIQFEVDTVVEFEFVESNGAFVSTFGVVNLETGEKTPLVSEAKPANTPQDVNQPSDFQDDTGSQNRDDFYGAPGEAVPQPLTEFVFKANTKYTFYLESTYNGRPAGILYSTDTQNPTGSQQANFEGNLSALDDGGSLIRWDDTGIVKTLQERDFDDFIVRAGGHQACPYNRTTTSQSQLKGEGDKLAKQMKGQPSERCQSSDQAQ